MPKDFQFPSVASCTDQGYHFRPLPVQSHARGTYDVKPLKHLTNKKVLLIVHTDVSSCAENVLLFERGRVIGEVGILVAVIWLIVEAETEAGAVLRILNAFIVFDKLFGFNQTLKLVE